MNLPWDTDAKQRFAIGGIGACLPILAPLAVFEFTTAVSMNNITGAVVRCITLFFLGGFITYLHSDEVKPFKLLQIGIAAPAMITLLITSNASRVEHRKGEPQPVDVQAKGVANIWIPPFISSAGAAATTEPAERPVQVAGVMSELLDGFTGRAFRPQADHSLYPNDPDWAFTSDGRIPVDAQVAGREALPRAQVLYVCRAFLNGGLHPGKIRTEFGGCYVPWGGKEYTSTSYQVLLKKQATWVFASNGGVPPSAMRAGEEHAAKQPLYICRAQFQGGIHPGKLRSDFGGCKIGWGGREHTVGAYEVLVEI